MPVDALEPGPDGTFPHFPRDASGAPLWSDSPSTDGRAVDGVAPMPRGERQQGGRRIDVTPRDSTGQPITPPTLPPVA
jgi:hypothetical protein